MRFGAGCGSGRLVVCAGAFDDLAALAAFPAVGVELVRFSFMGSIPFRQDEKSRLAVGE